MNTRQNKIITLLGEAEELSVVQLSELFKVSQVTVRKDIDTLVSAGYAKRRHGTVSSAATEDISARLLRDYDKKLAIASLAAELVSDGDTVLIESGSTCAILARLLAEKRKNLTIITNSHFIADFICEFPSVHIIVLGGELQGQSKAVVGPLAALCLKQLYGNFLFCGADGIAGDVGFTLCEHLRADTVQSMGKSAGEVCVLTTSDKLRKRGAAAQFPFSAVSRLFTDDGITEDEKIMLKDKGVLVSAAKGCV